MQRNRVNSTNVFLIKGVTESGTNSKTSYLSKLLSLDDRSGHRI